METRYYSGRLPSSGERQLALHASRKMYERITGHLDRKERLMEDLAEEAAHRKNFKEATKAMTSQWENSVENLRKSKEKKRQQRLAQKADDRVEQYYKVLKWQAEEREKYNKEVRKKIFQSRGAQRDINSSVLFSECLYENKKIIEIKNRDKEEADKDWKQLGQELKREDEKFKGDEGMKACSKRTAAKKNQEFIKRQILEREKIEENEKKITSEIEKLDIEKDREELAILSKNKEENLQRAKRHALKILEESREEANENRKRDAKTDTELEKVIVIFRDSKATLNCAREKMRREGVLKRSDLQMVAFQNLEGILNKKKSKEEINIQKALARKNETEDRKTKSREEYDKKLMRERRENFEIALQETKDKLEIEKERSKWETINRMKLMEICKNEKEQKDDNKCKKMIEYKKTLDEQVKENEEFRATKQAKEDDFKWNDYPDQDEKFLEYGSEMLAKQKASGKSTYPIELVITKYKKEHQLISPKSRNPCTKYDQKESIVGINLPTITRRICPTKNDSTGVQNCFCA